MTNELSVLLLTVAWLVRADDTPLHRSWLSTVADRLLAYQLLSGGIKQFFGVGAEAGRCSACPPTSNAAYGGGEQPLMLDGSEPLTDSLYSLNFAIIGLREVRQLALISHASLLRAAATCLLGRLAARTLAAQV